MIGWAKSWRVVLGILLASVASAQDTTRALSVRLVTSRGLVICDGRIEAVQGDQVLVRRTPSGGLQLVQWSDVIAAWQREPVDSTPGDPAVRALGRGLRIVGATAVAASMLLRLGARDPAWPHVPELLLGGMLGMTLGTQLQWRSQPRPLGPPEWTPLPLEHGAFQGPDRARLLEDMRERCGP